MSPKHQNIPKLVHKICTFESRMKLRTMMPGRRRRNIVAISASEVTTANGHLLSVTSNAAAAVLALDNYGTNSVVITTKKIKNLIKMPEDCLLTRRWADTTGV